MTLNDVMDRCVLQDGHWIWKGAMYEGLPRIWAPDYTNHGGAFQSQAGRRAVWHLKTGEPIPNGWRVFKTCTEKRCVAPQHIACREPADQGARVAATGRLKGQIARITANRAIGRKRSRLTPELIETILTSPKTGKELASEHGLLHQTVSKVRNHQMVAFEPVGGLFTGLLAANDSHRRSA